MHKCKKKMDVAKGSILIAVKNIKLMFFTGRRQVVSKIETTDFSWRPAFVPMGTELTKGGKVNAINIWNTGWHLPARG